MGAGKVLAIIGGILTLIGTFLLNWLTINNANIETELGIPAGGLVSIGIGSAAFVYGLGGLLNILFFLGSGFTTLLGTISSQIGMTLPIWIAYILVVVVILFGLGGIFQLIGVKSRAMAITGSILPIIFGVFMILMVMNVINLGDKITGSVDLLLLIIFGSNTVILGGKIPFYYNFMGIGIGTWVILIGSILALISGFMSRES